MIELISQESVSCRTTLRIRSTGDVSSVELLVEEARTRNEKGDWSASSTHKKQIVRFVGSDGAVELSGTVPEVDAVSSKGTQFEVVCLVEITTVGLPAFEAGRKGRVLMGVSLVGVVEVLDRSGKRVWSARTATPAPSSGGKTMDEGGRIK